MNAKSLFIRFLLFAVFCSTFGQAAFSQDYSTYNQWAKEAFDRKEYQSVIDYSTQSINLYPNGYAYWNRAAANYNSKNYTAAALDYGYAMNYYTDNESKGKLYFLRGESYYYDINDKDAMDDFVNADYYGYADKGTLYKHMTDCAYNLYDNEKTISYGKLAISYVTDPVVKSSIYSKMGISEYALKNYDNALDYLNQSISLNNNTSLSFEYRAYAYVKKSDYKKAFADMTSAIEIEAKNDYPYLSDLYQKRGIYAYNTADYNQCISDMEVAIKSTPTLDAHWYAGLAHYNLDHYGKAIEDYDKAIGLATADDHTSKSILYLNKALAYKHQLNYTEALKWLTTSLNEDKDYGKAYWNRAIIQKNKKQWTAALGDYDIAISLYQKDDNTSSLVTLYRERANVLVNLKDYDRAKYDFQKSISLNPEGLESPYEYGRFLYTSKTDMEKGKTLLQEYIDKTKSFNSSEAAYGNAILNNVDGALMKMFERLDSSRTDNDRYPWELHNTSCIYALLGNTKKALEYLDKSLEAGYNDYEHLIFDRDLASLTNLPEYSAILDKYKVPKFPK